VCIEYYKSSGFFSLFFKLRITRRYFGSALRSFQITIVSSLLSKRSHNVVVTRWSRLSKRRWVERR
uniref:Ovule protein n=1 Tax=Parascaris univalens TaxID=6257 RepID=A0A915A3H0_PARUN